MTKPLGVVIAVLVPLTFGSPASAQSCSDLQYTGSLQPGQTMIVSVTGAPPFGFTQLVFGENRGPTALNFWWWSFTINLGPPYSVYPMGYTNILGQADLALFVPLGAAPLPPLTLVTQAVTFGWNWAPPGPPNLACVSDTEIVQL